MNAKNCLGPFLTHPTSTSMGFWFFSDLKLSSITVSIDQKTVPLIHQDINGYNIYLGNIEGLSAKKVYEYSIKIDSQVYIPKGLKKEDLKFKTLPDDTESPIDFILMSCHGVEEYERKHSEGTTWKMWEKLNTEIDANQDCYFAVLGGDQVYMDDTFNDEIKTFKNGTTEDHKKKIVDIYIKYWGNKEYHKVFCRIPAFLMWDDHDLIDGFGSRFDSFKKNELSQEWANYKAAQTEAFIAFQNIRNPQSFINDNSNFSFLFQHGNFSLLSLDARSERNVRKKQMFSNQTWEKLNNLTTRLLEKDFVFINSPVTMARMGGNFEKGLGRLANYLWMTTKLFRNQNNGLRGFIWQFSALLILFTYQYELPGIPYALPNLIVATLSSLLLYRSYFGTNLFSGKIRTLLRLTTWGLLFLSSIFIFWEFNKNSITWNESQTNLMLKELILNSKEYGWFLVTTIIAHSFFRCERLKKLSILLPILNAALIIVSIFWSGIPGKYFNLNLVTVVLCPLISILFLVVGLLQYFGIIDEISSLDDDIKDGWSSEENKGELRNLTKFIHKISEASKKIVILSGDIHTGGLTEFKFNNSLTPFYQVTSSPITYPPMPPLVEKLTSGIKPIILQEEEPRLTASNLFFISQRNFAVVSIKQNKLKTRFIFEETGIQIDLQ